MPGMFGTAGLSTGVFEQLLSIYRGTWGQVGSLTAGAVRFGGHAFRGRSALMRHELGIAVAVDGEQSIYRDLEQRRRPFVLQERRLSTGPATRGNVAVAEPDTGELHLATEPSGLFPLYYFRWNGGLAFASHLRPLARALAELDEVEIDPVGLTIFLHGAFYVGERTLFQDIHRVLPGQSLAFRIQDGSIAIRETSRLWATRDSKPFVPSSDVEVADRAWKNLTLAARRTAEGTSRAGIFLSAGWDSRTLLAATFETEVPGLSAYSHGDLSSREIRLATQIRELAGLEGRTLPLREDLFDLDFLSSLFGRSEWLLFPYWARSAHAANADGCTVAMAGIYGEVLGGHYGPGARSGGVRRVGDVLARLLPLGPLQRGLLPPPSREDLVAELSGTLKARPWCLDDQLWRSHPGLEDAIREAVGGEFRRLANRGITGGASLAEAFTTEHRGAQYIGAQLRSARSALDVAAPFAHQEPLNFAATLPIGRKIHNRINRRILRRHAPDLLGPPLSATLVPASAPIIVQEASRFVRKSGEAVQWRAHRLTDGAIDPPRTGWINFEFLRESDVLDRLADQIRSDIWDREAIVERTRMVKSDEWEGTLHPLVHQFLKMLTVEWMIR